VIQSGEIRVGLVPETDLDHAPRLVQIRHQAIEARIEQVRLRFDQGQLKVIEVLDGEIDLALQYGLQVRQR
jgi:hypothetical protein